MQGPGSVPPDERDLSMFETIQRLIDRVRELSEEDECGRGVELAS